MGPICESADILGHDRLLPPTQEGDVLLIANAGAYGRAMSFVVTTCASRRPRLPLGQHEATAYGRSFA